MLAARKLDGEDPNIVFMLRCAYFSIQSLIFLLCVYIYIKASAKDKDEEKIVYIPAPPQPFADPDTKKKYTQIAYGEHIKTTARGLLGSTFFGVAITTGLHFYKGIIVGLAIQSIMGPMNLLENPLMMKFFFGGENVFGEKSKDEVETDAEVVDSAGQAVIMATKSRSISQAASSEVATKKEAVKKSLEDVILDTWDDGEQATLTALMDALNKKNVNYQTKSDDNNWTALMIASGLDCGVKGVTSFLKHIKGLGADPKIVDSEGWNGLHWAAFHGNAEAAKVLLLSSESGGYDGVNIGLHLVKDKEGITALDHAIAEDNNDVAEVISQATGNKEEESDDVGDEGLRRRKTESK